MPIPVIRLNLAPAPSLWRQKHLFIGWMVLGLGALFLCLTGILSWQSYYQAKKQGQKADIFSRDARNASAEHIKILNNLRSIDVQKELPRWKLAERILLEKGSPWSRLFAELERSMVQDVRIRNITRTKGSEPIATVKIKGEARSPDSEANFIESLHDNSYFESVILDRETERQGGGMEFELVLGISPAPPAYETLPEYGPDPKAAQKPRREASLEKTALNKQANLTLPPQPAPVVVKNVPPPPAAQRSAPPPPQMENAGSTRRPGHSRMGRRPRTEQASEDSMSEVDQ